MIDLADIHILFSRHKFQEAHEQLAAAKNVDPRDPAFHLLLGRAQHHMHLFKSAHDTLKPFHNQGHWEIDYWLGRNAVKRERPLQALEYFRAAVISCQDTEKQKVCLSHLARVEAACARFDSSDRHIGDAMTAGVNGVSLQEICLNSALIYIEKGESELALESFKDAKRAAQPSPETCYHLANFCMLCKRVDRALVELREGLGQYPDDLSLNILLGDAERIQGRLEDAAKAYLHAARISPKGALADYAFLKAGNCYYDLQLPARAAGCYEELLRHFSQGPLQKEARYFLDNMMRSDPIEPQRHVIANFPNTVARRDYCGPASLANLLGFWGKWQDQKNIGAKLFRDGVSNWKMVEFPHSIGFHSFAFIGSVDTVKQLVQMEVPVLVDEYEGLDGHYLVIIGYDDRKGIFIVQDPNYMEPVEITYPEFEEQWEYSQHWAAVVVPMEQSAFLKDFQFTGREEAALYARAEREFERAYYLPASDYCRKTLNLNKNYHPATRMLIKIDMMQQKWESAASRLRQWLQYHPRSLWGLKFLADAYHAAGNHYLAVKFYLEALKIYPQEYAAAAMLGKSYKEIGDLESARKWLRKSIVLNPQYDWPYIFLAELYETSNQKTDAIRYYHIALELNKNYTWVFDKLRELKNTH